MKPVKIRYELPQDLSEWPKALKDFTDVRGTLDQAFGVPRERCPHKQYGLYSYQAGTLTMFFYHLEERGAGSPFIHCRITARTPGTMLWLQLNAPEGYTLL